MPASIVYEDDICIAFLDIQPVNPGHVLVVPKEHCSGLNELKSEGAHLFKVAQQISFALRDSEIKSEGINFFLADGEAAGQEIFHVHLHVWTRFKGDGFRLKFGPDYGKQISREEFESYATQIKECINHRNDF